MMCHRHEEALLDIARGILVDARAGAGLAAHLDACAACRARLARERAMTAGLRAVAGSSGGLQPSAAVEAALLDAFRAMHPGAPLTAEPRTGGWRTWTAAAAAVLVMSGGLTFLAWTTDRPGAGGASTPPPQAASVSEFVPWPGAAALPAFESGELMRTELPASALPLLGLVPASQVTGATVTADVLVGQDGLARAVRLVNF